MKRLEPGSWAQLHVLLAELDRAERQVALNWDAADLGYGDRYRDGYDAGIREGVRRGLGIWVGTNLPGELAPLDALLPLLRELDANHGMRMSLEDLTS